MADDFKPIEDKRRAAADRADRFDDDVPENLPQNKEPAEGSRETAEANTGITNRPDDEERANQQRVPPRGESKGGSHA